MLSKSRGSEGPRDQKLQPSKSQARVHRVEYFPHVEQKRALKASSKRNLRQQHESIHLVTAPTEAEKVAVEYKEDPVYFRQGKVKVLSQEERDHNFEILQRDNVLEDDQNFMHYRDDFVEEPLGPIIELEPLSEDEDQSQSGFEDCAIDPNTFYKNAYVVESLNNGIATAGNELAEISMMSMSDLAVEKFLTGAAFGNDTLGEKLKKTLPKTTANSTQGNYSAIWFQDFKELLLDQQSTSGTNQAIRFGEHVLKNREDFNWIMKRYKYKEGMIPLTQAERNRVIAYQKPKAKVLLDPGVHETLEQMNNLLKRLQKRHIKKDEFLARLSKLHVEIADSGTLRHLVQQDHEFLLRSQVGQQDDPCEEPESVGDRQDRVF